jgi:hypothetical protein
MTNISLSQALEQIMDRTAESSGVPRTEMDNSLVFAAARLEDTCSKLATEIDRLEELNKALEKDATAKITQLMKNEQILLQNFQHCCWRLEIESTKTAYLGKLAQLHKDRELEVYNEEWATSCAYAAQQLGMALQKDDATLEYLKEVIKVAGTILVGGVPAPDPIKREIA